MDISYDFIYIDKEIKKSLITLKIKCFGQLGCTTKCSKYIMKCIGIVL